MVALKPRSEETSRLYFSISTMLAVILIAAMEFAALRSATAAWVDISRYATVAALVVATYLARHRTGINGSWWFGFALFGWAYYLLSIDIMGSWSRSIHSTESIVERLPFLIVEVFDPESKKVPWLDSSRRSEWVSFEARIIQSILVLVAASVGGIACRLLAAARRSRAH